MKQKKCAICEDQFTPGSNRAKYCSPECKEIAKLQIRDANKDKFYAYKKQYDAERKEEIAEYQKQWRKTEKRKDYLKKYFQENKEKYADRKRSSRLQKKELFLSAAHMAVRKQKINTNMLWKLYEHEDFQTAYNLMKDLENAKIIEMVDDKAVVKFETIEDLDDYLVRKRFLPL